MSTETAVNRGAPQAYVHADLPVAPLPEEPVPRPVDEQKPWHVKMFPPGSYPEEDVSGFPAKMLDAETLKITETPTEDLVSALQSGQLSSTACLEAFLRRAVLGHQLTNSVCVFLVDYARTKAKYCDDYLKQHSKPIGPLHGLPISLKDQHSIKGFDSVMGYKANVGKPAAQDSVIVKMLVDYGGAVPFCFTNVPQSLMRVETDSYTHGRTVNPFNRSFSSGGSSGGEGSLVGIHGSPLGTGTDIGGSVRFPSGCQGLFGLRSSMDRVPYEGSANSMLGLESIRSVIGPITHSLAAVRLYLQTVLAGQPWLYDPLSHPVPFRTDLFESTSQKEPKNLKVAIQWDNGIVHPAPPVVAAMKKIEKALVGAGAQVISWDNVDIAEAGRLLQDIFDADGGADIDASVKAGNEPLMPNIMSSVPHPRKAPIDVYQFMQVNRRKAAYRKKFLDTWQAAGVDVLITPVAPLPCFPHNFPIDIFYTAQFNLLDRPSLVFPAGRVSQEDLAVETSAPNFYGPEDKEHWQCFSSAKNRWLGMPIGLQLVGNRLREEELLGTAEVLRKIGVIP